MAEPIVGIMTSGVVGHSAKTWLNELHLFWKIDNWTEVQAAAKPVDSRLLSPPFGTSDSESIFEMNSPKVSSEQLGSSSKGSWQMKIAWRKQAGSVDKIAPFVRLIYDDADAAKQREIASALVGIEILTDTPSPRSKLFKFPYHDDDDDEDYAWTWTDDEYMFDENLVSDPRTLRQILEAKSLLVELKFTFCSCPYRRTFLYMPWSKLDTFSGLLSLYKTQTLTDFVLVSSDNKDLHVHRNILAASCEAFKAMLTRDTKEKRTGVCELADIDYETLKILVESFYGEDILQREPRDPAAVYRAADKYNLEKLKDICKQPLGSTLTVKNVVDRYLFGRQYDLSDLIEKAVEYVRAHYDEFLDHGGLKQAYEMPRNEGVEFFRMVGAWNGPNSAKRQRTM